MVNTTSLVLGVHTPLLIVHRRVTLDPAVSPVTVLVADVGVVMTAPLEGPIMLHKPLPIEGVLPANVKLPVLHWLIAVPATEAVGGWSFVNVMSFCVLGQATLLIVQRRVALVPAAIPVTVVVGELTLVIEAVPDIKLHVPVPGEAAFADNVKVPLLH